MDDYSCLLLENQLCFPLYACSKELVRRHRKPLEELNLTYTQYLVMMVLWESGDRTEGELGRLIHLDSGTLAPLLKRMEKSGLITRTRPAGNERRLLISLTEQGISLRDRALSVPDAVRSGIDMSDEELIQLKQLLEKVLGSMDNK